MCSKLHATDRQQNDFQQTTVEVKVKVPTGLQWLKCPEIATEAVEVPVKVSWKLHPAVILKGRIQQLEQAIEMLLSWFLLQILQVIGLGNLPGNSCEASNQVQDSFMTPLGHAHTHHVNLDALPPLLVIAMLSTEQGNERIPCRVGIQCWIWAPSHRRHQSGSQRQPQGCSGWCSSNWPPQRKERPGSPGEPPRITNLSNLSSRGQFRGSSAVEVGTPEGGAPLPMQSKPSSPRSPPSNKVSSQHCFRDSVTSSRYG